jgi:hypothetical protein
MFRVYTCLTVDHDWRLVVLAVTVCFLASAVAISLFRRAKATIGRTRLFWLSLDAAAAGCGIVRDCRCPNARHERYRIANPVAHAGSPHALYFYHGLLRRDCSCASAEGRSNLFPDQALRQTNFDQIPRHCPAEAWRRNQRMRLLLRGILHATNFDRWPDIRLKPEQHFSSYSQKHRR